MVTAGRPVPSPTRGYGTHPSLPPILRPSLRPSERPLYSDCHPGQGSASRDLWMGRAPGGGMGPGSRSLALACPGRSEEHTSELQSLMRISYAVFCSKKKKKRKKQQILHTQTEEH